MISPLRNRFGIPGAISVIALVFSMLGGAYAASNDSGSGSKASASAKAKKGPRGPRGPKGPVGPAGPAGAKGDTGAAGSNGTNGKDGASATTETFAGVKGSCTEGGVVVKSASPEVLVCNGKKGTNGTNGTNGSPWTASGTLPVGSTETGAWYAVVGPETEPEIEPGLGSAKTSISFPIPLAGPLASAKTLVVNKGATPQADCDDGVGTAAGPEHPEADSGFLCVFIASAPESEGSGILATKPGAPLALGASTAGAVLNISNGAEEPVFGTFAVTG